MESQAIFPVKLKPKYFLLNWAPGPGVRRAAEGGGRGRDDDDGGGQEQGPDSIEKILA